MFSCLAMTLILQINIWPIDISEVLTSYVLYLEKQSKKL